MDQRAKMRRNSLSVACATVLTQAKCLENKVRRPNR